MGCPVKTPIPPTLVDALPEGELTEEDRKLLNEYQSSFPLTARPYLAMAERLGMTEEQVIARLEMMKQAGVVSRVGVSSVPDGSGPAPWRR